MRYWKTLVVGSLLVSLAVGAIDEQPLAPPEGGLVPLSNVAGKKLIRGAREVRHALQALLEIEDPAEKTAFLREKVASWQDKGIDGVMFFVKHGSWWQVPGPTYEDVKPEIDAFQSIKDWGCLTDNFLWTYSTVWVAGGKVPDWFNDEDWQAVCANTRLAARLARECGFKGILLDWEQYGGHGVGVWRMPFYYKHYADEGYKVGGEAEPRPFLEVAAKVRQRGREYAEALTGVYPEIVLLVAASLYSDTYWESVMEKGGDLRACATALMPAFVDGLLLGLDERASLVSACERTYLDSTYADMLAVRDLALRRALVMSTVPELARKRIQFAAGIWTDAGWGKDRFSSTDVRVNQRDPEQHKHATHNALAASDTYAWFYGAMPWLTEEATPLMKAYWQATREARQPMDLAWEPTPEWDLTDYSAHNEQMAAKDTAFWVKARQDGWRVAVELPVHWRFRFSAGNQLRYRKPWHKADIDDRSWSPISCLKCWQSQGMPATGQAVYRVSFDVPADIDPVTQDIQLAFGAYSSGIPLEANGPASWADIAVNGKGYPMRPMVDVAESIRPGERNRVGIRVINHAGPAFLMGHVKLLVREGAE